MELSRKVSGLSNSQFRDMTDRVDNINLQYIQKERECEVLTNEIQIKEQSFNQERKAMNEEIDSLKEREHLLKNQLDVLQRHFEQIKQSNIPLANEVMPDTALLLQEQLHKAHSEVETLRLNLQQLLDENTRLKSHMNNQDFRVIKLEEEL